MSNYTKGPWRVHPRSPTLVIRDFTAIGCDDGDLIAATFADPNSGFFPPEMEGLANTRLMAAAPDLLEACQEYDAWADKVLCKDDDLRAIHEKMRAAIAKALGEKS